MANTLETKTPRYTNAGYYEAYEIYNEALFGGKLKKCTIQLSNLIRNTGKYENKPDKEETIIINKNYPYKTKEGILLSLVHQMTHQWQAHYGTPSRPDYHNHEWSEKISSFGIDVIGKDTDKIKKTGQKVDHKVNKGKFREATRRINLKKIDWDDFPYKERIIELFDYISPNQVRLTAPYEEIEDIYEGTEIMIGKVKVEVEYFDPFTNILKYKTPSGERVETKIKKAHLVRGESEKPTDRKATYRCTKCATRVWGKKGLKIICGECGENLKEVREKR